MIDQTNNDRSIGDEISRCFRDSDHIGAIKFAVVCNTVFGFNEDQIFDLVARQLPDVQRGQWEDLLRRGADAVLNGGGEGRLQIVQLRDSIYKRYTEAWEKKHKQ